MIIKVLLIVLLMSTLCLTHSCTSIQSSFKMYKGLPLAKNRVSLLVTQVASPIHSARVKIHSVDGQPVKGSLWDGTVKIELLPGSHTIKADLISLSDLPYYYLEDCVEINLDVMPGYIYEVDAEKIGTSARLVIRNVINNYSNNRMEVQGIPSLYTRTFRQGD